MKVAQRPDLLLVVVIGIGLAMAGSTISYVAASELGSWIYSENSIALDPTSPWIVFAFGVASWPAMLGLALGGRVYEDPAARVSAAAASVLAVSLQSAGLLLLPGGLIVQVVSACVVCGVLGASSMPGELRRGLGGAIGGVLAGVPLGLAEAGREAIVNWGSARWAYGTETNAAVELSTMLVQAGFAGGVFWILVGVGERLGDR